MQSMRIEALEDGSGHRVRLRDGRCLGIAEYGDPRGRPLLWFPGTPGSRLTRPPDESATRSAGVRIVVLERPGFGVSTPRPGRSVLDWAADVADVVDALELSKFAIGGFSGAGPYVCACAASLPDRVDRALLTGALGPVHERAFARALPWKRRAILALVRRAPELARRAAVQRDYAANPERLLREMTADAASCDRAVLARIWDRQLQNTAEALRQGVDAFCLELQLAASDWGFGLADIRVPVRLWHGELDRAAPVAIARQVAAQLPDCRSTFLEHEGHFLHFNHWNAILSDVREL